MLTFHVFFVLLVAMSRGQTNQVQRRLCFWNTNSTGHLSLGWCYTVLRNINCDPVTRLITQTRICDSGQCEWETEDYGTCSDTCGPIIGQQTRSVTCVNVNNNQVVPDNHCNFMPRPENIRECIAEVPCPGPIWVAEPVGECDANCGAGTEPQAVTCVSLEGATVNDSLCDPAVRPDDRRPCNSGSCRWVVGPRGPCSVTFGFGVLETTVTCVNELGITVPNSNCDSPDRPPDRDTCKQIACSDKPQWVSSAFGECSTRHGKGRMLRTVWCQIGPDLVDDAHCFALTKPTEEQECISLRCL